MPKKETYNIFADLGLPNAELEFAKASVWSDICDSIQKKKLSTKQTAAVLKTSPAEAKKIFGAEISHMSLATLKAYRILIKRASKPTNPS